MTAALDEVRRYYDQNTASFLRTGQGARSIRRAVWEPGLSTRAEAFRTADRRVLELLRQRAADLGRPPRVIDLGCGVGSSLLWLSEQAEFEGAGVTLSHAQAQLFSQELARRQPAPNLTCTEASYTALPATLGSFDLAFAIESFVHAPSAEEFLASVAPRLNPGARLCLCDDFLARTPASPRERRWLLDFGSGWLGHTQVTVPALAAQAAAHGLQVHGDEDLTGWLELQRPRDRALAVVVAAGRPFKPRSLLFRSWVGGDALQRALQAGLLSYRFVVFEKR